MRDFKALLAEVSSVGWALWPDCLPQRRSALSQNTQDQSISQQASLISDHRSRYPDYRSHLSSPLLKYFTFIFQVGILKVSAKLKAYSARVLKMSWKNLLFPLKKRVKSKTYFLIREQMCGPPHFLVSNQGYKLPTFSGFL